MMMMMSRVPMPPMMVHSAAADKGFAIVVGLVFGVDFWLGKKKEKAEE